MAVGYSETHHFRWNVQSQSDCLGEGAFGCVFLGTDKRNADKVAVKVFRKSSNALDKIKKETDLQKLLKHPNIIQLLAVEYELYSGALVIILEYCNGGTLHQFIQKPDNSLGLDDKEFLLVLTHLSEALAYLHKHHIIHRDLKPGKSKYQHEHAGLFVFNSTTFYCFGLVAPLVTPPIICFSKWRPVLGRKYYKINTIYANFHSSV